MLQVATFADNTQVCFTSIFFNRCPFVFKVHNEFILPSEKEGFIHRMGDIIKRAESLMTKEQPVHLGGHRLPQPAFHSGVNSLSSSQVSSNTCSLFPVIHLTVSSETKEVTSTERRKLLTYLW